MPPAPVQQPGVELLTWTEPLIRDVISAGYTRLISDHANLAGLVRCHALVWRCVLAEREDSRTYRRELARLLAACKLGDGAFEALNAQVVAELLDTIAARYTRSPREAGRLSFEVARAACKLAQTTSPVPA